MGSSNKSVVVGYRYFMGVQIALAHGPVDNIYRLIGENNVAWSGNVTDNTSVVVNAPKLFGGEKREGGWVGTMDIMMGAESQGFNPYLEYAIDGPVPAYRGITSIVFRGSSPAGGGKSWMWSTGNPYFKAPWVEIARYVQGWSRGSAWYPEKAKIGEDMNPAHIIYEALTNLEWGMGYSPADIDEVSFKAAADRLYDESFGLSLLWVEQTTIQDFVSLILRHVDGNIRSNIRTGLFEIRLIRDDYVVDDIVAAGRLLDPSNVIELTSFQRTSWGDTSNEVVIKYTDRNQSEVTLAVHDLAAIEAQGSLVSVTREYVGIREASLAQRVALRDLYNVSTPLAKVTLRCNRKAWDWDVTEVFVLSWPKRGLDKVPFRIIKIIKGDLINGEITIEAVEDIFGMPTASYISVQPPGWVDPIQLPKPAVAVRPMEVPYWDIARTLSAADLAYLPEDYAFGQLMAVKPSGDSFYYEMWAAPAAAGPYGSVGTGQFTPSGTLRVAMPRSAGPVSVLLDNPVQLDEVAAGTYAYVDNEAFIVLSVDAATQALSLARATLDTAVAEHAAGARIYFADNDYSGYDTTQRVAGETVHYKALTVTGKGTYDLAAMPSVNIGLINRAERPYPPGNVRVRGAHFPEKVYGPDLTVSWAHRDRLQQTVSLIPFTSGNIGPEAGTTYRLSLYTASSSLLANYIDMTGTTWTLSDADTASQGYQQNMFFYLSSYRGGMSSWQSQYAIIDRHGLGFHLGEDLGGVPA